MFVLKVAIIDSGVYYKHPALGGCFGPGCKVEFGYGKSLTSIFSDSIKERYCHKISLVMELRLHRCLIMTLWIIVQLFHMVNVR